MGYLKKDVFNWLKDVKDPEIPAISLIDLGVITKVEIDQLGKVKVETLPSLDVLPWNI